jgi:hypothetical protein
LLAFAALAAVSIAAGTLAAIALLPTHSLAKRRRNSTPAADILHLGVQASVLHIEKIALIPCGRGRLHCLPGLAVAAQWRIGPVITGKAIACLLDELTLARLCNRGAARHAKSD